MDGRVGSKVVRPVAASRPRRRFLRDRRGATAVEFALVVPIFLALMGATIETALAFWSNQILETALTDAARRLYTGQFQGGSQSMTDKAAVIEKFRSEEICKVDGQPRTTIFDCAGVKVDIRTVTDFKDGTPTNPIDPKTKDWDKDFGKDYPNPGPNKIVVVQAAVKFPIYFTLMNPDQASFGDGTRLLRATVAFKTEPF